MGGEGKSHRKKKAGRKADKRKAAEGKKKGGDDGDGASSARAALSPEQACLEEEAGGAAALATGGALQPRCRRRLPIAAAPFLLARLLCRHASRIPRPLCSRRAARPSCSGRARQRRSSGACTVCGRRLGLPTGRAGVPPFGCSSHQLETNPPSQPAGCSCS